MGKDSHYILGKLGLLLGFMLLFHPAAWAGAMYKCVENGKTRFTSVPEGAKANCQPLNLYLPPSNPAEIPLSNQKSRAAEDKAQAERIHGLIQNDPDTLARARRIELAKSLASQPVPVPSWGGRGKSKGRRHSQ